MLTPIVQRTIRNTLRRWPAKLVLLGYVWMCCGGTIPATILMSSETLKKVAAKDRSVPFPCMNKPCGCRTAEQCFKSCCCSTKAERIAWAKAHAVSEQYVALAEQAEEKPATKSCCPSKETLLCCQHAVKKSSCCEQSTPQKKGCEQRSEPSPSKQSQAPGFSMLAAMKCAGLQVGALGVPLSLPGGDFVDSLVQLEQVDVVVIVTIFYTAHSDAPSTPPPNSILA